MIVNGRTSKNKVEPEPKENGAGNTQGQTACHGRRNLSAFEGQNYTGMARDTSDGKKIRRVSPVRAVARAKVSGVQWKRFAQRRSAVKAMGNPEKGRIDFPGAFENEKLRKTLNRINAGQLDDLESLVEETLKGKIGGDAGTEALNSPSRALLYYFSKLAASEKEEEVIDLDFVDMLIQKGASPAVADPHGQAVIHEAARQWEASVMQLLLDKG